MNLNTKSFIAGLSLAGLLGGCAAVAPAQLIDARAAYDTSANGLAAKMAPTDLYQAKKVLDRANKEFEENGDTLEVRDYAYIAKRKVEYADARARTEVDRQVIAEAMKQGVVVRDSQAKYTKAALHEAREQLKDERQVNQLEAAGIEATNAAQGKELDRTAAQLEAEKQARMTAEGKLAGAMRDLSTIAAIREDSRGVVITLSGSVLFPSAQFALLETAKTKLDQVAEALKAQDGDRRMLVEGHTDSQGSDATNLPLSLNRANSVRDYLITRGVDAARISAIGLGSTKPVVNNNSAENRANNRRVEIVIRPARLTAR